ncbi:MAG TPA: hypothetical protein VK961_00295 [Chthoniobacter sp.]|nr:hypothetical protein [Chthoniobacter sp.]
MTEDEIFEIWAPRADCWSPWVKPVLFSFFECVSPGESIPIYPGLQSLASAEDIALVIDLPGSASIAAAITLASRGWRPVPLFNALPGSTANIAVPVQPLIDALRAATLSLSHLPLPPLAPPAFLLDARRRAPGWASRPETFDNRSISFPSDFPSATKLRERGIARILVIQETATPQNDLTHTLRQWQDDGLTINLLIPGEGALPHPCPIRKVTKLGLWWMKFVSFFTLHRARRDVFGRTIVAASGG